MQALYIWPELPALSIAVLIVGSMLFLFMARTPIHKAFESLSDGTAGGLKQVSDWAKQLAAKMTERNRKVLLESGIAEAERKLHEEFIRVEVSYSKHLADFPALQRRLDDNISKIETDFKECGQATPSAPDWAEAVASIAKLQGSSGDRIVDKMLTEINKSAVDGEKRVISELRNTSSQRHKILSGMAPVWKKISGLLKDIGGKVALVLETTSRIDKLMAQFEKTRKGEQDSIDMLSARTTKLFVFSLIVIVIAVCGAFVNFQLIALPVSELVPAGARIMGMPVSDFSAMVIICLEVMCGIFLMEALGVTNIIPQIGTMTRGKRRLVLVASLLFLFLFACAEASLGILREVLAEAKSSVNQALAGNNATVASNQNAAYAVIGQATLGFVLPWVLAMVAMPLEVLIGSSQHILNRLMTWFISIFGYLCKMMAFLIEYLIKIVINLYDAYIIVPTQIAGLVTSKSKAK